MLINKVAIEAKFLTIYQVIQLFKNINLFPTLTKYTSFIYKIILLQKGEHVPLSIKVGDEVLLPEYGGTKVELEENKEFHLFRESDILAKVDV